MPETTALIGRSCDELATPVASAPAISSGFQLTIESLKVEPGQLVMVCGSVGSGKSSLLSAMLGEMVNRTGAVDVNGGVAFVGQPAWIQNATVRDAVLFGRDMELSRYNDVVRASQLQQDIEMLPSRDTTEIGERGINLSGGQKQRVAIARALYASQDKDIFLFDDPLSAVDTHVASRLWEHALGPGKKSWLAGKTRVITMSSHYDLLPDADLVVVLDNGCAHTFNSGIAAVAAFPSLFLQKGHTAQDEVAGEHSDVAEAATAGSFEAAHEIKRASSTADPVISRSSSSFAAPADRKSREQHEGKEHSNSSGKLYGKENRRKGRVSLSAYLAWFSSASGPGSKGINLALAILFIYIVGQGARTVIDFLLLDWVSLPSNSNLYLYAGVVVATSALLLGRVLVFMHVSTLAARNFHNNIFKAVLRAPVNLFFDVTPTGEILNRFAADLDHVDKDLPDHGQQFLQNSLYVVAAVVVCALSSVYFLIVLVPIFAIYALTQSYYRRSSRELKRLEGITRSPIFSHFQETLNGLPCIRAYDMQASFTKVAEEQINRNNAIFFYFQMTSRWLAFRLDSIGVIIFVTVAAFALFLPQENSAENAEVIGLALVYSLQITGLLQWTVRTFIETENHMTAVERLQHYNQNIPAEQPSVSTEHPVSASWPDKGEINIEGLKLRYRPGLPLVLKGVNLSIRSKEKIGVVGRTGSGKSSLILALFRLVEAESGSITIDGHDIAVLGLHDLRSRLALIPQDPVLFSGDIRKNLDPFDTCSDQEIWEVLGKVELEAYVRAQPEGLGATVAEGGENFSSGQKQLICVGRALLRKARIIVLDEATASVDSETDEKIQKMIRTNFADATTITVAHRLDTIMDSDRVLVLDSGTVAQFDTPAKLLDVGGPFADLVKEMGKNQR